MGGKVNEGTRDEGEVLDEARSESSKQEVVLRGELDDEDEQAEWHSAASTVFGLAETFLSSAIVEASFLHSMPELSSACSTACRTLLRNLQSPTSV